MDSGYFFLTKDNFCAPKNKNRTQFLYFHIGKIYLYLLTQTCC